MERMIGTGSLMASSEKRGLKRPSVRSVVDKIVSELRATALGLEEGEFLGSEDTLCDQFETSAPTLRQAARLLEHEQVIKVKRGIHGGYFAHKPQLETLSLVAATYVRGNPGSLEEFSALVEVLTPFAVDLALRSGRLSELEKFLAPKADLLPPAEWVQWDIEFNILICEILGNKPLELILSVFNNVGVAVAQEVYEVAYITRDIEKYRIKFVESLLSGKRDAAIEYFIRHHHLVLEDTHWGLEASRALAREQRQ